MGSSIPVHNEMYKPTDQMDVKRLNEQRRLSLHGMVSWQCAVYKRYETSPDSKVHGANMGPTCVLSAPDGPHVGHMNLAIRQYTVYAMTYGQILVCFLCSAYGVGSDRLRPSY